MTPEIQWSIEFDLFYTASNADCEHAAWLFNRWCDQSPNLWWETLRDMMLHGY